jgi:saccharopine dehydrogenase-like NADP-dependent oxidoreductase
MFKPLLDFGLASENLIDLGEKKIIPRNLLIEFLLKNLPSNEEDVVLLKVLAKGIKEGEIKDFEYKMIDYYDKINKITSMMRTTSYPTSIIAQMIESGIITKHGVFGCEEIVPCSPFFKEIEKRDIRIKRDIR